MERWHLVMLNTLNKKHKEIKILLILHYLLISILVIVYFIGPKIHDNFYPIIQDFNITERRSSPISLKISGNLKKVFSCELKSAIWYYHYEDEIKEIIKTYDYASYNFNRATGKQKFVLDFDVSKISDRSGYITGNIYHNCGLYSYTVTQIGPIRDSY
jgi:hypothetical protein